MAKKTKNSPLAVIATIVAALETATEGLEALKEILSGEEETTSKKGASKPKGKPADDEEDDDDLASKKIQELRKIAKSLGVPAGGSREALIEAILEAQEESDEDEDEDSDDEDDEESTDLDEMDLDELKELAKENSIKLPRKSKGEDEDDYLERVRELLSEQLGDDDEDEDDDEEDDEDEDEDDDDEDEEDESEITVDDLDDLDDEKLEELCEEFEIEMKKFNRKKAIKLLTEAMEEDED